MIYPIAFQFRHAIELGIKGLLQLLPRIWGENAGVAKTHKLLDNWKILKIYLEREEVFDPDGEGIAKVDSILIDFLAIDPEGQAFRYPTSNRGEMHLEKLSCINIGVLEEAIEFISKAFDYWFSMTNELIERQYSSSIS